MLCEMCKKNQASVHIIKVINGVKQELNICDKCAHESEGIGILGGDSKMDSPFTFQNILGGLVDYINQTSSQNTSTNAVCPICGMTYGEFRQKGLMGCSNCYKNFETTIMPVVKRVQGNIEHVGKIPVKAGKEIMERKKLLNLKEQLQKAVLAEEYERAAELRDIIRQLQNGEKEV